MRMAVRIWPADVDVASMPLPYGKPGDRRGYRDGCGSRDLQDRNLRHRKIVRRHSARARTPRRAADRRRVRPADWPTRLSLDYKALFIDLFP
jgi:hypothetical protein